MHVMLDTSLQAIPHLSAKARVDSVAGADHYIQFDCPHAVIQGVQHMLATASWTQSAIWFWMSAELRMSWFERWGDVSRPNAGASAGRKSHCFVSACATCVIGTWAADWATRETSTQPRVVGRARCASRSAARSPAADSWQARFRK